MDKQLEDDINRLKKDLIAHIKSQGTKLDQMTKVGNSIATIKSLIEENNEDLGSN